MKGGLDGISPEDLDVLTEIGNIGAGNAASALASMLDRRIAMTVPSTKLVPFKNITDLLGGPEAILVGVMVNMSADLRGFILLLLGVKDAYEMANLLLHRPPGVVPGVGDFTEIEISAITEIANILVGSFLAAISSMTKLGITPSVPSLTIDMAGAIMSLPAIEYGAVGDVVLMLETLFTDNDKAIEGHLFLIPELESYYKLMTSLGIMQNE